jgi:signal transduction histidine kinase
MMGIIAVGMVFEPAFRPDRPTDLVLWALAAAAATFATVSTGRGRPSLSMDLPVLLACAFVEGPLVAGAVALVAVTNLDELRGRTTFSRTVWNHSQTSLCVVVAGFVFHAAGGEIGTWPIVFFAALAALLADVAVNYLSVAFLISASEHRSLQGVLGEMRIGSPLVFGLTYLAFGLTGLLMAELFLSVGPVALLAAIAPLILARDVFVKALRLESIARQLRMRAEALMRVDERIADEREDERARIAEALDRDVLQSLYTVTLRAHVIGQDFRSGRLLDLEADVPELVRAAELAADELRKHISGLRESSVGHAGLIETVSLLVAHLQDESGMTFVVDLDRGLKPEPFVELVAYQAAREALGNLVRHSRADTAWVTLKAEKGRLHLVVLDNGTGFDADRGSGSRQFGLGLLRDRVENLGGAVDVRSSPGGGTCVEVWLPLTT